MEYTIEDSVYDDLTEQHRTDKNFFYNFITNLIELSRTETRIGDEELTKIACRVLDCREYNNLQNKIANLEEIINEHCKDMIKEVHKEIK